MATEHMFIAVIHANEEPWESIVSHGQIPFWNKLGIYKSSLAYFVGLSSEFSIRLNSSVECLRWKRGRFGSYFISYLLKFLFLPFQSKLPRYEDEDSIGSFPLIKVYIPETTFSMRWKRVAILDYFITQTNSEFLIMINSSSLINPKYLAEEIRKTAPDSTNLLPYAGGGPILNSYDGPFISGAFIVLNRITATLLLNNLAKIPVHVMDDVAFGVALTRLGIKFNELKSITVDSLFKLNINSNSVLRQFSHYRCKSYSNGSRNDIEMMEKCTQIMDS
jgi:hypothetical protein